MTGNPSPRIAMALVMLWVLLATPAAPAQCSFEEDLKLRPADGAAGDAFGGPVAVDGDVMVAGAPTADGAALNSGAVYVYRRTDGGWVEEAKLTAPVPGGFDNYGIAVAVEGDVLAVGAFFDDVVLPDQGSVYLYRHDGNAWQLEQHLTAAVPGAGDRFGRSVDLEGDRLAIGAYRSDTLGIDSGSAYVFEYDNGTWVERQQLVPGDGAAGDLFGVAVSLSGDALLVGSYFDDTAFANAGSGYVFRHDGASWQQEQKLTALDGAENDDLGATVALLGDTAVMGAYWADAAGIDSGAAYVFRRSGGVWTQVQKLVPGDGSAGDEFGWDVSLSGPILAVSAYEDDQEGAMAGSAYVYRLHGATWVEERKLVASDAAADDLFANSLFLDGTDLWVGSTGDDDGGVDSGAAYHYDVRLLGLELSPTSVAAGETLTFTTAPGHQGELAALFAVELGGNPVLVHILTLPYGADCRMEFSAQTPAGLSGAVATFQSWGYALTGEIVTTNAVTLTFL